MMRSDLPVQFLTLLHSNKLHLSEEDGWLLAQINSATLSHSQKLSTLSLNLLEAFKGHSFFSRFNRACFAVRLASSNRLKCLDSAVLPKPDNGDRMSANYSCFLDHHSSLFDLRPGSVRIFEDISAISETYGNRRQPIQRSLNLLSEMGFASGIAIPAHLKNKLVGVLFLNSGKKLVSSHIRPRYQFLLSSLQLVAGNFFLSHPTHDVQLVSSEIVPQMSEKFDTLKFMKYFREESLMTLGYSPELQVEIEIADSFLYVPSFLVGALVQSLKFLCLIDPPELVQLHFEKVENSLRVSLDAKHSQQLLEALSSITWSSLFSEMKDSFESIEYEPQFRPHALTIVSPWESHPTSEQITYSC